MRAYVCRFDSKMFKLSPSNSVPQIKINKLHLPFPASPPTGGARPGIDLAVAVSSSLENTALPPTKREFILKAVKPLEDRMEQQNNIACPISWGY